MRRHPWTLEGPGRTIAQPEPGRKHRFGTGTLAVAATVAARVVAGDAAGFGTGPSSVASSLAVLSSPYLRPIQCQRSGRLQACKADCCHT